MSRLPNEQIEYKKVSIDSVHQLREKSVIVRMLDGETRSIPRTCLSYKCDKELENLTFNVREIEVARWFCEKEDL